ncbi:DUF927 domain-containing protein [Corticicoccus populi]|uniref:DUF927 domain-containing protein n=1 Tax=Corticicoccus populi TaxID=1812821 RepID=A0ABW5WYL7_9STAP
MELKEGGWYEYNPKTKKEVLVAPPIRISKKRVFSPSNKTVIEISLNGQKIHEDDMAILSSRRIEELATYGLPVHSRNKVALSAALMDMAFNLPETTLYEQVGLINDGNGLDYYGDRALRKDAELDSKSPYNLSPSGSAEEWMKMFKEQVEGNTPLEFAVVLGVSGVVLTYLKDAGKDVFCPVVHISGESSTGKTTAAKLALSTAGSPKSNKGLFDNWNATSNAIIGKLSNNMGIPVCFDEISASNNLSITDLIYTISEGVERSRSDVNGVARPPRHWSTIVLSTGEMGIDELPSSKKNIGLNIRTFSFKDTFTNSAQQSENIKSVIHDNYGHILPQVASELLETPVNTILEIYDEAIETLKNSLTGSSDVADRLINHYAAFLLAATTLNCTSTFEKHDVSINEEELFDFLVNHEKNVSKQRDLAQSAFVLLIEYLINNQNKIVDKKSDVPHRTETIGFFEQGTHEEYYIRILRNDFKKFCDNNGFQGHTIVARALKDKKYFLTNSSDRTAMQESTDGERIGSFYKLLIPKENYGDFEYIENQKSSSILENNQKLIEEHNSNSAVSPFKQTIDSIEEDLKGL